MVSCSSVVNCTANMRNNSFKREIYESDEGYDRTLTALRGSPNAVLLRLPSGLALLVVQP